MGDSVFSFGENRVGGDQYNQNGTTNIGKIESHQSVAIRELNDFLAWAEEQGLVLPGGLVTDENRLRATVRSHPGRLRRVAAAVAGGSKDALMKASPGIATTLILQALGAA
ncbi:hypothetical protein [Cryptosporangium arvum]|uniref:Uncharacterized protein n=1 Tax=Cryptosporangium arvum DSM 44712 TaxID=927661 RepID=A0A010YFR9_9ACTN|nr:hypothetical protein [Cryptosporangium arvum]EXG79075.1 hypothetical protein CryarDRAFT_0094 [Cryptosporangium arvum DSM 44712]